ncbi:hypothetical protein F0562_013434 [Nyssa sinensis]|uniref:Uncharacterized protein n=1 Tax=Nyssa sinensis TaxID=561372 RepID=A0A5J4ZNF4_9ASTE|nr:hypothetical protein F0562_013434 [Nyssa sinensis]
MEIKAFMNYTLKYPQQKRQRGGRIQSLKEKKKENIFGVSLAACSEEGQAGSKARMEGEGGVGELPSQGGVGLVAVSDYNQTNFTFIRERHLDPEKD